jgi:hypothetical protein
MAAQQRQSRQRNGEAVTSRPVYRKDGVDTFEADPAPPMKIQW